jgi:N-glycosylase/DNA lyase
MNGISNNLITISDLSSFDPTHILESGQVFRYYRTESGYKIFSQNLFCSLIYDNARVIIDSNRPEYFYNYFDLGRDYGSIKQKLSVYPNLTEAIEFGKGIRILNQDPAETVISFIISANNNIPRIKKIIERLCVMFGEDMGGYYAFPTAERLAEASIEQLREAGTGYRAEYIKSAALAIKDGFLQSLSGMDTPTARKHLMSQKGIGGKVADCILLFGYHREDVFPTDVWISRVYQKFFAECETCSREQMSKKLVGLFGNLSGYAQQYLFYHIRQTQKNTKQSKTEEQNEQT